MKIPVFCKRYQWLLIGFCLLLSLLSFTPQIRSAYMVENAKIGLASAGLISQSLPKADSIQQVFEDYQNAFQKEMAAKQAQYDALKEKEGKAGAKPEQVKIIRHQADSIAELMRASEVKMRRLLEQKGKELYGPLNAQITSIMESISKETGCNIILNSDRQGPVVLYVDKSLQLDSMILSKIAAKNK